MIFLFGSLDFEFNYLISKIWIYWWDFFDLDLFIDFELMNWFMIWLFIWILLISDQLLILIWIWMILFQWWEFNDFHPNDWLIISISLYDLISMIWIYWVGYHWLGFIVGWVNDLIMILVIHWILLISDQLLIYWLDLNDLFSMMELNDFHHNNFINDSILLQWIIKLDFFELDVIDLDLFIDWLQWFHFMILVIDLDLIGFQINYWLYWFVFESWFQIGFYWVGYHWLDLFIDFDLMIWVYWFRF